MHGDKISQEDRLAVDRGINELKEAMKSDDVEKIKHAKDELLRNSQKLGEAVYKASQEKAKAEAAGNAGAAGAKADAPKDDVVDAEVVDGDKK